MTMDFPWGEEYSFTINIKQMIDSLYLMTGDMQLFFSTCHIEDKSSFLMYFLIFQNAELFLTAASTHYTFKPCRWKYIL